MAVAIDGRGVRLDEKHVPVAVCGYEELEQLGTDSRVRHRGHRFLVRLARFLTEAIRSSKSTDLSAIEKEECPTTPMQRAMLAVADPPKSALKRSQGCQLGACW